jgi:hypothetical protein
MKALRMRATPGSCALSLFTVTLIHFADGFNLVCNTIWGHEARIKHYLLLHYSALPLEHVDNYCALVLVILLCVSCVGLE